jgi:hypothetical protein
MKIAILIFVFYFLACSMQVQSKLYAKDDDSDEEVEILEPKVAVEDVMVVIKSTYGQSFNIKGSYSI